jgi:RNA recognition motif-containing protein
MPTAMSNAKSNSNWAAPRASAAEGLRIFVTKIPPSLGDEQLREYFGAFGELSDCYMPRVPGRGGHKGICFVTYVNPKEGEQILASPTHVVAGEEVAVDRAVPREEKGAGKGSAFAAPNFPPNFASAAQGFAQGKGRPTGPPAGVVDDETRRLFITKVSEKLNVDNLREYFEAYGEIDDVYVPRQFGTNRHKGIAFVSFVDPSSATGVLSVGSEGHIINGEPIVVDRAAPRDGTSSSTGKGGAAQRSAPYPTRKGTLGKGASVPNGKGYGGGAGWFSNQYNTYNGPAQSSYPGVQRLFPGYGKGYGGKW